MSLHFAELAHDIGEAALGNATLQIGDFLFDVHGHSAGYALSVGSYQGGHRMTFTPDQRKELEALGPENVRTRLIPGTGPAASVGGFKTGNMDRGDIEDWLGEKHASKVQFDRVVLLAAIIAAVTGVLTFAHDYFK